MRYKSFTSERKLNKYRHQFPLAKDDNGVMLFPWDYVKLSHGHWDGEWCSQISFSFLDGAFIDAHPDAIKRNGGKHYDEDVNRFMWKYNDETIVKITKKQYDEWVLLQSTLKYIDKPRQFELPRKEVDEDFDITF